MKQALFRFFLFVVAAAVSSTALSAGGPAVSTTVLPLLFEQNRGQFERPVLYLARARNYVVALNARGHANFLLPRAQATARFSVLPTGFSCLEPRERAPGLLHYYRGSDPGQWITDVPQFGYLSYRHRSRPIELRYRTRDRDVEMEFHLDPGARPESISLQLTGATRLSVEPSGELRIETPAGVMRWHAPSAYQDDGPMRKAVTVHYRLKGSALGFSVAGYDRRRRLIIDPVVTFSTYFGGSSNDGIYAAAHSSSSIYVAGETWSNDLPSATGSRRNRDAFVSRLSADGKSVLYTAILGSAGLDTARGLAVDPAGNAYVAGSANGAGFPVTTGALRTSFAGVEDAFAAKLDNTGRIVYATYLGGSGSEAATGIAVDPDGNAYIGGYTSSGGFPTTGGAAQTAFRGGNDAFLTKLNAAGSALVYSTLLGGARMELARALAVNANREACIAGSTDSTDLTQVSPLQARLLGASDAFVACVNAAGSSWIWSTYLGGNNTDEAAALTFSSAGDLFAAGSTLSPDFPTTVSPAASYSAGWDGFVTRLNLTSKSIVYSTLVGGSGTDAVLGIQVDGSGQAWVTGHTSSVNFPSVGAMQSFGGTLDAFVTAINGGGTGFVFSTFLGGGYDDRGYAIALSGDTVYAAGLTMSTDLPVSAGVLKPSLSGAMDGFLVALPAVLPPVKGDMDGNGHAEVLLQYKPNFNVAAWYMGGSEGKQALSFGWITQGGANGWNLAGAADFDSNGKPDLVWQHSTSFDAGLWHMAGSDGRQYLDFAWLSQGGRTGWTLAGVADMDGNGKPDLLWQNSSTYQVEIWYMGGAAGDQHLSTAGLSPQSGPDWRLAAVADFDGDGKTDLVWQSEGARQVALWYMTGANGTQNRNFAWILSGSAPGWRVVGAADFDRNGKPDIVWQHDTSNAVLLWYMQGAGGSSFWYSAWLDPNGSPGWRVVMP